MNTNLRAFVPNLLTLCNLLCGCVGIWLLFAGHPGAAGVLVFVAALFDVFDGMVARMLGVSGPLGVQLDCPAGQGFAAPTLANNAGTSAGPYC